MLQNQIISLLESRLKATSPLIKKYSCTLLVEAFRQRPRMLGRGGPHYSRTLWYWVARLETHAGEAKGIVDEEKYRVWPIYMAGSAHAFERRRMSLFQILAKWHDALSAYRGHVYRGARHA